MMIIKEGETIQKVATVNRSAQNETATAATQDVQQASIRYLNIYVCMAGRSQIIHGVQHWHLK